MSRTEKALRGGLAFVGDAMLDRSRSASSVRQRQVRILALTAHLCPSSACARMGPEGTNGAIPGPSPWKLEATLATTIQRGIQMINDPLELAILFHQTYERLAPSKATTRTRKRIFDPESPNGKLMVAVCTEILPYITADRIEVLEEALAKNVELTVQDSATILRAQAAAVPREPTDAMLDAGVNAGHVDGSSLERDVWQAMYAAAPEGQA